MSAITDEMVEAGIEEIRKAKHTCFDRWTDNDAIRAVLEASVAARIAALEAENERLRKALKFYADAWCYTTNPKRAGLEWKPASNGSRKKRFLMTAGIPPATLWRPSHDPARIHPLPP